ncbi:MAG: FAD-dependent oxidoreductase, partial [Gemmatimonadota bacterium]
RAHRTRRAFRVGVRGARPSDAVGHHRAGERERGGEDAHVERDGLGRLPVDEMLRVEGVPGVYATGDIAWAYVDDEKLALMSCQHAMYMGRYAGYNAARDLLGLSLRPYRQPDYAACLDLWESGAMFTTGWDR